MFQKSIFHRSRQEENYQKLIQTIERDRLLDKRGTHFMTFTFPYVVGRNGYVATPFGMSDVSTAQDLIGDWAFHMDQRFLGQNIKKKSLDLRMKWIVIPEVKTKEGEKRVIYSLRHTFCELRLQEGVRELILAKNMGTSVEMIYRFYGSHSENIRYVEELTRMGYEVGKKSTRVKRVANPSETPF